MANEVYKKLAAVQSALYCPKGQANKFGGYSYRSCEDILKAVKPLLAANGLALVMSSTTEMIGEWHYINVRAAVVDAESGDAVESFAQAREPESREGMDAAQVSGSSLSYARKYALAGLFGIDNEKDPDATNTEKPDGAPQPPKMTAQPPKVTAQPPKPSQTAPRATVDFGRCPCGKSMGVMWDSMPTETLKQFLALTDEVKAKHHIQPGHVAIITNVIKNRAESATK